MGHDLVVLYEHPEWQKRAVGIAHPRFACIRRSGSGDREVARWLPREAVANGERIMAAGELDVGGIEYLESADGGRSRVRMGVT